MKASIIGAVVASFALQVAAKITKIVAFGDSLSDTGNAYKLTNGNNGPAVPPPPYWNGRFSNGPVYIELIAQKHSLTLDNHAIGGATTDDSLLQGYLGGPTSYMLRNNGQPINVPGVAKQISTYLANNAHEVQNSANVLYTILVGGNDGFDLPAGSKLTGADFAKAQAQQWYKLSAAGAKNILAIMPPPNSLFLAEYCAEMFLQAGIFKLSSSAWHTHLELGTLPFLLGKLVTTEILNVNLESLFKFQDSYFQYGISTSCCNDVFKCHHGFPSATYCSNPSQYLLWDGTHPTAAAHQMIANYLDSTIASEFGY